MDQDQEKKATGRSVSAVADVNTNPVELAATQMQHLGLGVGAEESQIEGCSDRAQPAFDPVAESTTPIEPIPGDIAFARPSVGQDDEQAAAVEPSVVSEAAEEAEDILPPLISQNDEAVNEVDNSESIVGEDDQVDDFHDSQQYPRGGPLDIDPADRRLDYKERAQKAEMKVKELEEKLQKAERRMQELETELRDSQESLDVVLNSPDHQAGRTTSKIADQGGRADRGCSQCKILINQIKDYDETLKGYVTDYEDRVRSHEDQWTDEDRDYVASPEDARSDDGEAPDVETGNATEGSPVEEEKEDTEVDVLGEEGDDKESEP